MKRSNVVKGIVLYAIGFGLLAYIIRANWDGKDVPPDSDHPAGRHLPGLKDLFDQTPEWGLLLLAGCLFAVALFCQFSRWYILVRAVDLPFTYRNGLRLGLVGYFYSTFLPGSIGGDAVKAFFIVRDNPAKKAVAFATVIIDRLFGLFGLLLFAAVVGGIGWANENPKIVESPYLGKVIGFAVGGVAVAVVGWVVMGLIPGRTALHIQTRLHHLKFVGKTLAEIWFALRTYRERPKAVYLCVLISALAHVCMVTTFHLTVRVFPALAADAASLAEHFVLAPIGFIGQVFVPVPGGVGGAEAIFGYLYKLFGHAESTGAVGRLTLRAIEWTLGFLGYLMFLQMKKELPADTTTPPPAE